MSINKVQLKQEELVDSSVVLTDINPITDTESVNDVSSGSTMKETIDRIWNAINTKLSRVVNSVNGRTGVVIIDANDVGLGNVDNVSYQEIKEWVLEQIQSMLNGKHLRLYGTLDEVRAVCATGDKMYDGVPFYTQNGETGNDDKLSYIGYYTYNEETQSLSYDAYPINVIGWTDNSIIYNETVVKNSTAIDMSGGGLAVNIHPDEEALYVENSPIPNDKANSGLRIDPAKLNGGMIFSDALYQNDISDTTALLASYNDDETVKGPEIRVFINDIEMSSDDPARHFYLNKRQAKPVLQNTLVFTNFKALLISGLRDAGLMNRQPAIGIVSSAPSKSHPNDPYIIKFYSIKQNDSYGLTYHENHTDDPSPDGIQGILAAQDEYGNNYSGLSYIPTTHTGGTSSMIMTPWMSLLHGESGTYEDEIVNYGLRICSDSSIATFPIWLGSTTNSTGIYDNNKCYGSHAVINWTHSYGWRGRYTDSGYTPGVNTSNTGSFTTVNENKLVLGVDQRSSDSSNYEYMNPPYKFYNVSGLKHMRTVTYYGVHDDDITVVNGSLDLTSYGIMDNRDAEGNYLSFPQMYWRESGGLSVNTGKFLEILPVNTMTAETYNAGGKVQVRIGDGLQDTTDLVEVTEADDSDWAHQVGFPDGDREFGINNMKRKEYQIYVNASRGPSGSMADIGSGFSLLHSKPTDWKYGFAYYCQKVECDYYHDDTFYLDSDFTNEATPVDKAFYIDLLDHTAVAGKGILYRMYQYNEASLQYIPKKYVSVLYNLRDRINVGDTIPRNGYVSTYSSDEFVCPDWDELMADGIEIYERYPTRIEDLRSYGYTIYEKTSSNRIRAKLDEPSGIHFDANKAISYSVPEYDSGIRYNSHQFIFYSNGLYITMRGFTSTDWATDADHCILIKQLV